MKKNAFKKLELKKNVVASLSKNEMTMMGGITGICVNETDACATGKYRCYLYSNQSCTQYYCPE